MNDFDRRLEHATEQIGSEYFQLPVFGSETPAYRERVYCYELYYQLRKDWPDCAYRLSGEVDKSGHPVIRRNGLDNTKPDFLIHVPEDMDNNFAVIEVKPVNGRNRGVRKDIATLRAYLDHAGYERALYLIYGGAEDGRALKWAGAGIEAEGLEDRVELWHHARAGLPAERLA